VPPEEPAQVGCLGRADPVDGVPTAAEEHRDRQPRRPGRLDHDLQAGVRGRSRQGGLLDLDQTLHGRERFAPAHDRAVGTQHPHGMGAGDPQVDPNQPSILHLVASLAALIGSGRSDGAALLHGHGPKVRASDDGTHSCAATGPDPAGSGHFPHPGHPWPAKGGNQTNEARRTSAFLRGGLNATPGTSRDPHATLGPWYGSSTAVPYMRRAMHLGVQHWPGGGDRTPVVGPLDLVPGC
jgi:hypothetical protein